MKDFTNYTQNSAQAITFDVGLRRYMIMVYNYMAAALALTGLMAFVTANSDFMLNLLYKIQDGQVVGTTGLGMLVMLAPIGLVLGFAFGLQRMSLQGAQTLFWVYSFIMGMSLSSIFLTYTGESITRVFFVTASVFGAMSLYGYTTKKDLTSMGSFLIMGLMGVIIASLVNIFLKSSGLQFALSVLSVLIFVGLTAYDTQKIKHYYYNVAGSSVEMIGKTAIMGALNLYLDFINIFLQLLRFMGDRK